MQPYLVKQDDILLYDQYLVTKILNQLVTAINTVTCDVCNCFVVFDDYNYSVLFSLPLKLLAMPQASV